MPWRAELPIFTARSIQANGVVLNGEEHIMGSVENQVATAADVQLISGGQIVAKMLKQEGIKHILRWPGSAVN